VFVLTNHIVPGIFHGNRQKRSLPSCADLPADLIAGGIVGGDDLQADICRIAVLISTKVFAQLGEGDGFIVEVNFMHACHIGQEGVEPGGFDDYAALENQGGYEFGYVAEEFDGDLAWFSYRGGICALVGDVLAHETHRALSAHGDADDPRRGSAEADLSVLADDGGIQVVNGAAIQEYGSDSVLDDSFVNSQSAHKQVLDRNADLCVEYDSLPKQRAPGS